jgi:hypothetical protein
MSLFVWFIGVYRSITMGRLATLPQFLRSLDDELDFAICALWLIIQNPDSSRVFGGKDGVPEAHNRRRYAQECKGRLAVISF